MMTARGIGVALLVWLAAPGGAAAQDSSHAARVLGLRASRVALEDLAARLDAAAAATDSSPAVRQLARAQAAAVRLRLSDGDFQAGDRIVLHVEGSDDPRAIERQLSDTFVVAADRTLLLPALGVVPLRGVLRAEVASYLGGQVGRIVRDPVIRAQALIRVSVIGAVAHPGFYAVPADAVLSDALMAAGGPSVNAKLEDLRIDRLGVPLWDGSLLQRAVAEGRTLDEMQLRAGDQFVVPLGGRGTDAYNVVRTISLILSIPITIFTLTKIF